MKYIAILFLVTFSFRVVAASTVTAAIPAITHELYAKLSHVQTLEGTFTQTIKDHDDYVLQSSSGTLILQRPANIYWQTFPPYEQLIVGNEEKLWVYDPDLEQATIYANDRIMLGPIALLAGSVEVLHSDFSVDKIASNDKAAHIYVLIPKANAREDSSEQNFDELRFTFNDNDLRIIGMKDKLQQTTVIELADVAMNHPIDAGVFTFSVPAGTDILENR